MGLILNSLLIVASSFAIPAWAGVPTETTYEQCSGSQNNKNGLPEDINFDIYSTIDGNEKYDRKIFGSMNERFGEKKDLVNDRTPAIKSIFHIRPSLFSSNKNIENLNDAERLLLRIKNNLDRQYSKNLKSAYYTNSEVQSGYEEAINFLNTIQQATVWRIGNTEDAVNSNAIIVVEKESGKGALLKYGFYQGFPYQCERGYFDFDGGLQSRILF